MDGKTKRMIEKFKNLTLESKVFYIFITFITIWFIMILSGCTSSIYKVRKEQIKVTHVLAITEMGDTLQIPIKDIKPRVIYNVVGYVNGMVNPYYRPYNYYDYYPYSVRNPNYIRNNTGNSFGISDINPTTQIPVPSSNNNSSTSGFTGNPIAINPVTSGGKVKKKN